MEPTYPGYLDEPGFKSKTGQPKHRCLEKMIGAVTAILSFIGTGILNHPKPSETSSIIS